MAKLAAKMSRDQRARKLGSMDEDDSNAAINVWSHVYSEIAGMVADYRGSLMCWALCSGKAAAQAILKKVEADAAVGELVVGDMQKLKTEWDEGYVKALMKQEVAKLAAAKIAASATYVTSGAV